MKIHILAVARELQPTTPVVYPAHHDDYGVEQDFLSYLLKNHDLLTDDLINADWVYLPVFWTRWLVSHDYGKKDIKILQGEVNKLIVHEKRMFTVCQYDDGPIVNVKDTRVYLSSRMTDEGRDIPLLCKNHKLPLFPQSKKYLASFVGRLHTSPYRYGMYNSLKSIKNINLLDGDFGEKTFVRNILKSYVSLCPRGYGGSSFRFYESMSLGVVPALIGDIDSRPFKDQIDWNSCSFYFSDVEKIADTLLACPLSKLLEMGKNAKSIYNTHLTYGKWGKLLINDLKT